MSTQYPSFAETSTCPASQIQLQFWVIHEFAPDSPSYNQPCVNLIEGDLDAGALEKTINAVLRRYPVFRTTFAMNDDGVVMQKAAPVQPIALKVQSLQLQALQTADDAVVRQAVYEEIRKPFDLAAGPPIRFRLLRIGPHAHILVMTAHHIVFDLATKDLLAEILAATYRQILAGQPIPDSPEQNDYAVFSAWQHDWMQTDECKKMEGMWRSYLEGAQPALRSATDNPPETESNQAMATPPLPVALPPDLFQAVKTFSRQEKVTPYLVLLAAWALTLARASGQSKLCVGIPMSNRRKEEFKNTLGCFVNSLPLTFNIADNPTLREALRRVRMGLLQLHRMQEMPYYHLVQIMRRDGIIGGDALYQAGFTFEHPMRLQLDGLNVKPIYIHPGGPQLDLFATFWEESDGITGIIKYDETKLRIKTVEALREQFLDAARKICADPELHTEKITLIPVGGAEAATQAIGDKTSKAKEEAGPVMAVASSFSAEFIGEFLDFWFDNLQWNTAVRFAAFNQVFQELLDPSSLLRTNRKGCNVVMLRLEDLIDKETLKNSTPGETQSKLASACEELKQALSACAKNTNIPLCFILCPPSPSGKAVEEAAADTIELFLETLRSVPGMTVLTYPEINRWYPVTEYYEPIGETLGAIPYTRDYLTALSTSLVRSVNTLSLKPVKALVVDCDGTLWQGVVGEDGPAGVVIGPHQRDFQEFLIKQYQAGVILCLCSKNREEDAWSVFDQHPGMLLKREHISFWKINWEAKSDNLRALVKDMNIGMDAVAFLDDNPLERAEVGLRYPAIFCPEFPDAWGERTRWLEHCWLLDHPRATAEDKKRQDHYRSEQIRDSLKQSAGSLAEFLEKLELKIDLNPAEEADYDRLAQLSVRTNQFNTTTLRLTTQDVAQYATTPGMSAHIARVRDRFGDYGLVGAMLASAKEGAYRVDGMFLSCRALGRSVEFRMASYLAQQARQAGLSEIIFPVKTTDRNEPARTFLTKLNELCGGNRDSENGLHLGAEKLAGFRYESVAASVEEAQNAPGQDKPEAADSVSIQNREPFVRLAGNLRSVDAILRAVERKAIDARTRSAAAAALSGAAPESQTEKIIADVWRKILGIDRISTQTRFFEVGGTSLLMVRIAIELKRNYAMNVSIIDLFKYPTISELASYIDGGSTAVHAPDETATLAAKRQREALSGRHLPDSFKRLKEKRR